MTPYRVKIENSMDALSRQPLISCDAEDVPRFCQGNISYKILRTAAKSEGMIRVFHEDIRRLAGIGQTCDENKAIFEILRGDVK